jgi:hypothetical protein
MARMIVIRKAERPACSNCQVYTSFAPRSYCKLRRGACIRGTNRIGYRPRIIREFTKLKALNQAGLDVR